MRRAPRPSARPAPARLTRRAGSHDRPTAHPRPAAPRTPARPARPLSPARPRPLARSPARPLSPIVALPRFRGGRVGYVEHCVTKTVTSCSTRRLMPAVLFGSIGTLADTSELQREAFNERLRSPQPRLDLGPRRVPRAARGQRRREADRRVRQLARPGRRRRRRPRHQVRVFQQSLRRGARRAARPASSTRSSRRAREGHEGGARHHHLRRQRRRADRGTEPGTRRRGLRPHRRLEQRRAAQARPDAYRYAVEQLGEQAGACVAIEDNVGGVAVGEAAGVHCVAFPGENNAGHDFARRPMRVAELNFDELRTRRRGS